MARRVRPGSNNTPGLRQTGGILGDQFVDSSTSENPRDLQKVLGHSEGLLVSAGQQSNVPKDAYVLTPRTCEYVTLRVERDSLSRWDEEYRPWGGGLLWLLRVSLAKPC